MDSSPSAEGSASELPAAEGSAAELPAAEGSAAELPAAEGSAAELPLVRIAPRVFQGLALGLATELCVGFALWEALRAGGQSLSPLAGIYFAGHGLLLGAALGIVEGAGARSRLLGFLGALLGALVAFGGARFLQELIVEGNALLAYGSLIKSSGGFRWSGLGLYLGGALCSFWPLLVLRWRGAGWVAQAYGGLAGVALFGALCLGFGVRLDAFGPTVYALPLAIRVVLFPLLGAALREFLAWRSSGRERAERVSLAGGKDLRARGALDPRARHKARYLEGKADAHLRAGAHAEAGEALAAAADLWPSAKRHLSAAIAFAQAEDPYRALVHLERVLEDPGHDPAWLEAEELSYLKELEAWAPLAARWKASRPKRPGRTKQARARRAGPRAPAGPVPGSGSTLEASSGRGVSSSEAPGGATEAEGGRGPDLPSADQPSADQPSADQPSEPGGESAGEVSPGVKPRAEGGAGESGQGAESSGGGAKGAGEAVEASAAQGAAEASEADAAGEGETSADLGPGEGAPDAPGAPDASDAPGAPGAPPSRPRPRRRVSRRREATPPEPEAWQRSLSAVLGLVLILGYVSSFAWTPDASAESVRELWAGRVFRRGPALYGLGLRLDRGAPIPPARIKAASSGLPGALLAFGIEPATGQCGITAEWAYRSSARLGEGRAMLRLAEILLRASPPRPYAVSELLRGAAEAGEPHAMFLYGSRLRSGEGLTRDPAAALVWVERAAEGGQVDAQFLLANWLELGHGESVPRDPARALSWFRRAARNGHSRAGSEAERLLRRFPELQASSEDAAPR